MSDTISRRLSLLDSMILMASAAFGLAMARAALSLMRRVNDPELAARVSVLFTALAVTLSILPLQFFRPPDLRRRLRRQPGTVACSAVLLTVLYVGAFWILGQQRTSMVNLRVQEPNVDLIYLVYSLLQFSYYSLAVAGAWLALALSGRWRPPTDWLDRAGRFLGACWLVSPLIVTLIDLTS